MSLEKSAEKIQKAHERSWVSRVMWFSLDERIGNVFNEITKNTGCISMLGGLYLSKAKDLEPIKSSQLCSYQYVNSTHIHTGYRLLGVNIVNKETKKLEAATESNAQLWYSQSPSGTVLVFVAPYSSNAGEIDEKEIIIGKYKEPVLITCSEIENHFNIFFKYCSCTSQHGASSFVNYLYRRYLIFNDFRYKATFRNKLFRYLERVFLFIFGAASILVTLYVGNKL